MASKSVGTWLRQVLGGRGKGEKAMAGGPSVGMHVLANDGTVLGTISTIWRGSDATDGAPHPNTLGVRRTDANETGILYIPTDAVARVSDKGVTLTVDGAQIGPRGWRFRPAWLAADESEHEGRAGWGT